MPRRLRVHFKGIYSLSAGTGTFTSTGNAAALGVGGSAGGGGGGVDWAARSSAPGVVRAFGFDATSQLGFNTQGGTVLLGYTASTSYGYKSLNPGTPTIDLTSDVSGQAGGSLKFTFAPNSDGAWAGEWTTRFSDDDSFVLGPNQKIYFQFRYKHDGMPFDANANPQGVKMAFIDVSGDQAAGVVGRLPIVWQLGYTSGALVPYFYPQYPGNPTGYATFAIVAAWGVPTAPQNVPTGVGVNVPANEWVTFTGSWELRNVLTQSPYNGYHIDGTLSVDMIRADGTRIPAIRYGPGWYDAYNNHSYIGFPWKISDQTSPTWTEYRYGKWVMLPYTTSKDPTITTPEYHFWYDQFIISQSPIADPATAPQLPAWRQALVTNQVTDIATNIPATPFRAAGYDLDPYKGDAEDFSYNSSAWGAGCHNPYLGNFGALIMGADGHENQSGCTLHHFDLETATWQTPIGAPQIHRQVTPSYTAPPAGTEFWWNPDKQGGVTDLTYYQIGIASPSLNGGTFTLTFNGQTTSAIAWNATAATIQSALEALSNVAPGDITMSSVTLSTTGARHFRFGWTTASNAQFLTVNTAGLTATDGTLSIYLFQLFNGLDGVTQERDSSGQFITRSTPFAAGPWSFAYFPLIYGPRASPNCTGGHRYDNMAVFSSAMSGEASGSIYFAPMTFVNQWETTGGLTGSRYASVFGCTSRDWLTMPTNAVPTNAPVGDSGTFVSEKHKKIFAFGMTTNAAFAVYDPSTNSHDVSYMKYPYEFVPWSALSTIPATACIVTEGHPFHLFITAGVSFGDYVTTLLVHDGDEVNSRVGVGVIYDPNGVNGYGIYPQTYTNANGTTRLALLDSALPWSGTDCNPALAWSAKHRRLIFFNMPNSAGDYRSAAPLSTTIRIITIPETNWKTDPWHVETRTLTAQTGIRIGRIPACYKRVFYSDDLDCLILAGGPEQLPSVQALALAF